MKNVIMLAGILAMVSCGTSEGECTHDNVIVLKDSTESTSQTLDVSEIETVGEFLDALESIPFDSTVVVVE